MGAMLADLLALLDKPVILLIVMAIGGVIGLALAEALRRIDREKRRSYWRRHWHRHNAAARAARSAHRGGASRSGKAPAIDLAADQLKAVMRATFKPRALLNKPERRLLNCIDQALAEYSPGWRAMGQVSLGEVLWSQNRDAFWAINAKRVDLMIVDADCRPLHAVEFQGTGHHMGAEAAARDAAKREALRRAGIGYIEVVSGDTPAEVRKMVRKLVGQQRTAHAAG